MVADANNNRNAAAFGRDQIATDRTEKALHASGVFGEPVVESEVAPDDHEGGIPRGGETQHLLHGWTVLRITALDKGEGPVERRGQGAEAADLIIVAAAEFVDGVRMQSG